jgi:predicted  nucleic acid-binding Zn-ribbon protein
MISCNQGKIKQLEQKTDSLMQQAYQKDQSLNEFLTAFNEIQDNLDSIKEKEMIITETTKDRTELKKTDKDQINEDINSIYELLNNTQDQLAELRKKLGKANYQVQEFEKMIDHLTKQIAEKDEEIELLRQELEQMNIKVTKLTRDVSNLTQENKEKEAVIEDQTEMIEEKTIEINTGFYAVGTKKVLKDNNVITSEGGFIGIGKNQVLKDDFDDSYFTRIDIRKTTQIPIPGKKAEVVTTHPPESYKVSGEGDNQLLEILNYEEFWKSSKYLVVIVD